jgi:DNA-binding LacI/PurR family transcriptional regulator
MRITIKDIAAAAGVSKTTVSFAFNDPGKISKDTCENIMRIAEELGYVPDPLARTLTTKRVGTIGFLLPQPIAEAFKNPYIFELLQGIGSVCHGHVFSLTIVPPVKGKISQAVRTAVVDGLLTVGVGPHIKIVETIRRRTMPFVTIDGESSPDTSNVGVDDRAGARELMRYVLALGHRRIAIVAVKSASLSLSEENYSRVREMRFAGFSDAFAEAGLSFSDHDSVLTYEAEVSLEGGFGAGERLLAARARPTAVVCMSDIVAHGIYEACRAAGVLIPGDMTVVGFDDIEGSRLLSPGLTTVHQPGFEKGRKACDLLIRQIEGDDAVEHVDLPTSLILRGSAGAPMSVL